MPGLIEAILILAFREPQGNCIRHAGQPRYVPDAGRTARIPGSRGVPMAHGTTLSIYFLASRRFRGSISAREELP
jgi:hypothetical protein